MESMNVHQLAKKLNKLNKVEPSTYQYWLKSIKPIQHLAIQDVSTETSFEYRADGLASLGESMLKTRISYLKGIWNKARK